VTVRLVSATRSTEHAFWSESYLGRSLRAIPPELRPEELAIRFENVGDRALGLPAIYNRAIESASADTTLLFVHDDVFIHDPFIKARLAEGLCHAHVLGLAGSRNSDLAQPSWGLSFAGEALTPRGWQNHEGLVLAGTVSHAHPGSSDIVSPPPVTLSRYGEATASVDLLDGLFLAARAGELWERNVTFDERFTFHHYDLDFCRSARRKYLELMTWPILVTHGSGGDFTSESWKASARQYLDKWSPSPRLPARASPTLSPPAP